jgi:protein-tyrosine kinase
MNSTANGAQPTQVVTMPAGYAAEQMERLQFSGAEHSIGSILVKFGRMSIADAERVLALQKERNLRFGDAAIALGVATLADIEFALSLQFEYPYLLRGESAISDELIAAYEPFSSRVEDLRVVRNQLMWRWFETAETHRALAVVSAERGDGRSFIAANLAVVFSQQGQRTLLIDADMRQPRLHQLFNLENRAGLSSILSGRKSTETIQGVLALPNLSILTAGAQPPNPLELVGRPLFAQLLLDLATQFDVILIDTPAGETCADAQTIAVRAGAALLISRKDQSRVSKVNALAQSLKDARVNLLGSVLNDIHA